MTSDRAGRGQPPAFRPMSRYRRADAGQRPMRAHGVPAAYRAAWRRCNDGTGEPTDTGLEHGSLNSRPMKKLRPERRPGDRREDSVRWTTPLPGCLRRSGVWVGRLGSRGERLARARARRGARIPPVGSERADVQRRHRGRGGAHGRPLLGLYQGVPLPDAGTHTPGRAAGQDHDLPRAARAAGRLEAEQCIPRFAGSCSTRSPPLGIGPTALRGEMDRY